MLRSIVAAFKRALGFGTADVPAGGGGYWITGTTSKAGERVDEETALNYAAVFRAVQLIAGTAAMLPVHVYRGTGNGKERLTDHPLEALLNRSPNGIMTATAARRTQGGHVLTAGNGIAEVIRDGRGNALELWPLHPSRVEILIRGGELLYRVDGKTLLTRADVLHLAGPSPDGVVGWSPIRLAREAIGLGLATESCGAGLFGSGGVPRGVLEYPGTLGDEQYLQIKRKFAAEANGEGHGRTMILEGGMKFTPLAVAPEEAQFLETRKFQISEIARWYGVPPHLLGDLERATFSNIEQQAAEFLSYCLQPWLVDWAQAYGRQLLRPDEQAAGIYLEYLPEALYKVDLAGRYAAYSTGRMGGWLSINEIRSRENLPPIGPAGDVYLSPLNMTDAAGSPAASPDAAGSPASVPQEPVP